MLGDFYKEEEKLLLTILTILFLRPYEVKKICNEKEIVH